MQETIFAQSSAKGKAGVAVFRISGIDAIKSLLHFKISGNLTPKKVYLRGIFSRKYGYNIDKALVIYFKSPSSFTGEDLVEIHTHGSIAITKIIIEELLSIKNFRIAEPGEFSKRAFLNGKIDLVSAEGLADLIESETIFQHKQAVKQFDGELYKIYQGWREKLISLLALLEAYIDFPDEEIPDYILSEAFDNLTQIKSAISHALKDNRRGERLRSGISLAILGRPNVGKSSLINYITQREISIVSDIPGTTRDIIESYIDIGGYPIIISDTAGINFDTEDKIEKEGIKRAIERAKSADIKILLFDVNNVQDINDENSAFYQKFKEIIDKSTIFAVNKIDELNGKKINENDDLIFISIKNNIGLEKLLKKIETTAEEIIIPEETPMITRARHRNKLELAFDALERCVIDSDSDIVLTCEDIRLGARHLSILTGKIEVDEILGEIFGKFCIGK